MIIMDGKKASESVLERCTASMRVLKKKPRLGVIQVEGQISSDFFVRKKKEALEKLGIGLSIRKIGRTSTELLLKEIAAINDKPEISSILVQMPLPKDIDLERVAEQINPSKDIEGLNRLSPFISPVNRAILFLLDSYNITLEGKHVVIINNSRLIGRPLGSIMSEKWATVTLCHEKTKELFNHTKTADVLISATGIPGFVRGNMIKKGSVIVDVGANYSAGVVRGDVNLESVKSKVSHLTPVPGGVGPLMIAMLAENVIRSV